MRPRVLLALSVLLCSTAAVAGLKEGYKALSKKDYVTAAILALSGRTRREQ